MKVGSLVYATDQGLGILAKSFVDAGVVTDVMVVRHGRHETHDWYPGAKQVSDLRDRHQIQDAMKFCEGMDLMLFFETPFLWELIPHCKRVGVKTVLMPMFECEHQILPSQPDFFLNPSLLDQQYYPSGKFLVVPVEYPWKQRTKAISFVHNAGHGGLKGRNGTAELVEAMRYVKSEARLTLRAQESSRQYWAAGMLRDANDQPTNLPPNVDLKIGTFKYEELFSEGDVFVFPEKFNGLSLPLQEARAAGMLVMCGDRFPMNIWLPTDPLISVQSYRKQRVGPPYNEFDEAVFHPKAIAQKIDEWYERNITQYSLEGKYWAEENSWAKLKPRYMEVLEGLVNG